MDKATIDRISERVQNLCMDEGEFQLREGYSGRNMAGAKSPLAFVSIIHPSSDLGRYLRSRWPFEFDNMGPDWIYYLKG